jgi:hypothetical protein
MRRKGQPPPSGEAYTPAKPIVPASGSTPWPSDRLKEIEQRLERIEKLVDADMNQIMQRIRRFPRGRLFLET